LLVRPARHACVHTRTAVHVHETIDSDTLMSLTFIRRAPTTLNTARAPAEGTTLSRQRRTCPPLSRRYGAPKRVRRSTNSAQPQCAQQRIAGATPRSPARAAKRVITRRVRFRQQKKPPNVAREGQHPTGRTPVVATTFRRRPQPSTTPARSRSPDRLPRSAEISACETSAPCFWRGNTRCLDAPRQRQPPA